MTAQKNPSEPGELYNFELPSGNDEQEIPELFGGDAPEDSVVWVYELEGIHGERGRSYLYSFPRSDLHSDAEFMEEIKERYGFGRYGADLKTAQGKYIRRVRFTIGSERERRRARAQAEAPEPQTPAAPAPAPAPAQPAPGHEDLPPMLAAMLKQQSDLLNGLLQTLRPTAPAPASDGLSALALLRELREVKDLFGGGDGGGTKGALSLLRDVLALKDELGLGGGGDSSAFANAARALAGPLSKALDRLGDAPAPGAPAQRPPVQQPHEGQPMAFMSDWLTPVIVLAGNNTPPPDAAREILGELAKQPEYIEQMILGMIDEQPQKAKAQVLALAPQLANHGEWLDAVIADLVRLIREPEPQGDAAAVASS